MKTNTNLLVKKEQTTDFVKIMLLFGSLSLFFWILFLFCFVISLGSHGPYGDIFNGGVYLIKNCPIVVIVSVIPATYVVVKAAKYKI